MPVKTISLATLDLTQVSAIKPAQGLRYGNFEGIRYLPPINKTFQSENDSLWSATNGQICQIVCQWMESWQQWQCRTFLCGIANRCTVSQLEILSTTFEPFRQRYLNSQHSLTLKGKKAEKHQVRKVSSSFPKSEKSRSKLSHKSVADSVEKNVNHNKQICQDPIEADHSSRLPGQVGSKIDGNQDDEMKEDNLELSPVENTLTNTNVTTGNFTSKPAVTVKDKVDMAGKNTEKINQNVTSDSKKSAPGSPNWNIDQYASLLSSSIFLSAFNDIAAMSIFDENHNLRRSTPSNNLIGILNLSTQIEPVVAITNNTETVNNDDDKISKKNSIVPAEKIEPVSQHITTATEQDLGHSKHADSGRKISQVTIQSSRPTSTKFLGGFLEFASDRGSDQRVKSSSGQFRYSTFASSNASTTEYFDRRKLAMFGPMQCALRTGSVQRPLRIGSLPVSLQKYYKNSKWWPMEPPVGKSYIKARKQELVPNFKEQLHTIWKWFSHWEGPERISFMKEVLKKSSESVLDALITHIQQRLDDTRDINRLPDKLILYILSYLSPHDILRVAKVCRRWRYLCARDDLWILKCLEFGESEGISNIPYLIQRANENSLGIDWMLAYTQLRAMMETVKMTLSRDATRSTDNAAERDSPKGQSLGKKTSPKKGSVKMKITDFNMKEYKSYVQDCESTSSEEDLPPIPHDIEGNISPLKSHRDSHLHDSQLTPRNLIKENKVPGVTQPQKSQTTLHIPSCNLLTSPAGPSVSQKELTSLHTDNLSSQSESTATQRTIAHGAVKQRSTNSSSRRSKKVRSREMTATANSVHKKKSEVTRRRRDSEDLEPVFDMRTNLAKSQDLLGKLVSRANLEWESPETYTDEMRVPVYAGKVASLKRMRKLEGHLGGVTCLYFDARRLVTCGLDRAIRLWDVRSGRSLHKFIGHKGGVRCVQFDNDIMASGSWDCLVMIWSMRQFANIATLLGHTDSITCLEFSADFMISGSDDRTVRIWGRPTFYCAMVLQFDSPVLTLVVSGHQFVVTVSNLKTELLHAYTGARHMKLTSPLGPINSLVVHGSLLMGGDSQGRVCFWNMKTGEMEAAVQVHEGSVNKLAYHRGRFYTASSDSSVKEWDLKTMTCLRVLKGHVGPVRDVKKSDETQFADDVSTWPSDLKRIRNVSDQRIISCGDDGTTRIWDLGTR